MRLITCYVLLQLCALAVAQTSFLDAPLPRGLIQTLRTFLFRSIGLESSQGARYLNNAKRQDKLQPLVPDNVPFPCDLRNARSAQIPTSVHRLRPGDIDVIGVLGDSLSAGVGILSTNVEEVFIENRGVTGIGGGIGTWRQYLTLPNILKVYNPKLVGYAYGDSLTIHEGSQLNVAESGAMLKDLSYMAEVLIERIKRHPKIDFQNHWKLIIVNIGSNDFCSEICYTNPPWALIQESKKHMLKALRIFRDKLPRSLIVLSSPPHLKNFVDTDPQERSLLCYIGSMIECSCMFALKHRQTRQMYYDIQDKWYEIEAELTRYPEFHRKDFDVISAPCLRNATIPKLPNGKSDTSYIAADCFHVSQKSNARYANCLWNNLLEPINRKTVGWTALFEKFLCPTEKMPYIPTHGNTYE